MNRYRRADVAAADADDVGGADRYTVTASLLRTISKFLELWLSRDDHVPKP